MRRILAISALALTLALPAAAQMARPSNNAFTPDGSVNVPAFTLPPSGYFSPEALAAQQGRATLVAPPMGPGTTIEQRRAGIETYMAPQVEAARARYPVNIVEQTIGGVRTQVVTPANGEANRRRVLINLHGGGFEICAEACAMVESIPIASLGRYKVVTVDYRQGPEHRFPAASEDVAAVYRELLRTYRPENIGIFGCSAGGALTAQATAWFQTHDLPTPGAIGIFGSGAVRGRTGDSTYVGTAISSGVAVPPPNPGAPPRAPSMGYFAGASMDDPMVSPGDHPEVLARFPPTLIITAGRAFDFTPAIVTHQRLLNAGVDSNLLVAEGLGHCYIYDSDLPEARDASNVIVRFFDRHLGQRRR